MLTKPLNTEYIANEVKKYLKEHLKIEIEYNSPSGLCKGFIKATLKLDDEVIDTSEQKIYQSFF